MTDKRQSTVLPHGFKKLSDKKTFVAAYISVRQLNDPWKTFKKNFIRAISEAQGSNVDIDMLVSRSYAKSLETTRWLDYKTLGLQSGYLYPTVSEVGFSTKIQIIEDGILDQNCVDVVYSSNKISKNGDAVKIKRLYVGKIYDYNRESNQLTLKIDDTYRTFKIDKIDTVDEFSVKTKAEVRHLKVELEPLTNGGTLLSWTEILGENNEAIAKPWSELDEKKEAVLRPLSEKRSVEAPKPKPKVAPKPSFNHLAAEAKLDSLYNELITVVESDESKEAVRTSMKLKGFQLYSGSPKAVILGEDGINIEVNLNFTKIIRKKNSETLSFSS